jgi:N-ethylmaleimide reductase
VYGVLRTIADNFSEMFGVAGIYPQRSVPYIAHTDQPLIGNLMSKLHSEIQVGPHTISHRVALAPLTRMRAEAGAIPGKLMAEYYSQRTSEGGLLIGEATIAAPNGNGYLGAPGLYDDSQIAGWKLVTDAVHAKGGKIFLQLYHAGRQSNSQLQPGGALPVAPSTVEHGGVAYTESGWVPNTPPRTLTIEEIKGLVERFRDAAKRGIAAGFDGVELHSANGYLFDQFLQDGSNKRTDIYGGSFENRSRFLLEAVHAVIAVWGSDRVAVRMGPSGNFGDMSDSDPEGLFSYVARELDKLKLAYLHLIEPRIAGHIENEGKNPNPVAAQLIRKHYKGTIIVAGGFDGESANAIIEAGYAELVAFGHHFIANPDLPARLRNGWPLNPHDRPSFFGGTEIGYTDYPFHAQAA